jgi:hypothetical protein
MDNTDLDNILGQDAWYEPKSQGGGSSVKAGKYEKVLVKDLNVKKDIVVSGKFLADIYEPVFDIDGKDVKHKGFFRFKKPDPAKYPQLQSDMGSNAGYHALCDMMDMVQKKDDKLILPELDLESFKRFLFNVEVVIEEWVGREGNDMQTPRVKMVLKAETRGKEAVMEDDDLPF